MKRNSFSLDPIIPEIMDELIEIENCHAIILYGSRARGDDTPTSDYDIAGITKNTTKKRIARFDPKTNSYLDVFIIPENELSVVKEEHITMAEGICIFDTDGIGEKFIKALQPLLKKVPHFPPDEIQARQVWYQKMLARTQNTDIEGRYRQIWILYAILEDYFVFRDRRYLGPKKAFQYLEQHDKAIFILFQNVLSNFYNLNLLEELITKVCKAR